MPRLPKVAIIVVCIGISFFISSFIYSHYFNEDAEFKAIALKEDVQTLITSLSSFHLEMPQLNLISTAISPTPAPPETEEPVPTIAYDTIPTSPPISTPYLQPTTRISVQPTYKPYPSPTHTPVGPTSPPPPTKAPKPTKGPDVFPIDPAAKRPGETVDDIIAQAAAKACAPKEVLRTLASIESGGFFDTVTPKYLLLYNSENWWNSEFITEEKRICSGYAYDGNTGIVFSDSKYAGYKCREGSGSGLGVVGVMSLSPYLFSHYKDQAAKAIGSKNVDRRIIFDSLVMAGMNIKENTKATTCTNWDARTVVKAACSYYGSCGTKDGTYYCATFCRNYQKYGGKDCSGAISQFTDTCWK